MGWSMESPSFLPSEPTHLGTAAGAKAIMHKTAPLMQPVPNKASGRQIPISPPALFHLGQIFHEILDFQFLHTTPSLLGLKCQIYLVVFFWSGNSACGINRFPQFICEFLCGRRTPRPTTGKTDKEFYRFYILKISTIRI